MRRHTKRGACRQKREDSKVFGKQNQQNHYKTQRKIVDDLMFEILRNEGMEAPLSEVRVLEDLKANFRVKIISLTLHELFLMYRMPSGQLEM